MSLENLNSILSHSIVSATLLGFLTFLAGCSERQPDGQIYLTNGLGITLPAAGVEVAFIPGASRADFFYEPVSKAYAYATADLNTALAPACDRATETLTELQKSANQELQELQGSGTLPEIPEACFNMCTQRVDLENQREQDREQLGQTINRLNTEIVGVKSDIKALQSSRSEKAGEAGSRLKRLKSARGNALRQRADELLGEQIAKISLRLGGPLRRSSYQGTKIGVSLVNNTDYAIKAPGYSEQIRIAGYYRSEKIIETGTISLPRFGLPDDNHKDALGFDKNYFLAPGQSIPIGDDSIYDLPGLSLNSPSGRLLAQENGWTPNSRGYILPDEIRIVDFPASLLLIPDEEGTRVGSEIVYSPRPVNFRTIVAEQGMPQDAEIARLSRQMQNQSFPEDYFIVDKRNLITKLTKQKKQANDNFNSSVVATEINQLSDNESTCRSARVTLNSLNQERDALVDLNRKLASCSSENLDATSVFSAIASLNSNYSSAIDLPDISGRYELKALELVYSKLSAASEITTRTGMDGSFYLNGSAGKDNTLLFAAWESSFGQAFWLQPLASLGDRKDLSHTTATMDSFKEYVQKVVSASTGVGSVEELAERITWMAQYYGYETNPSLQVGFKYLQDEAEISLNALEIGRSEEDSLNEIEAVVTSSMPLACEA